MSDYEREIHFQPPECGNCGQFMLWDDDLYRWVPGCMCTELEEEIDHEKTETDRR